MSISDMAVMIVPAAGNPDIVIRLIKPIAGCPNILHPRTGGGDLHNRSRRCRCDHYNWLLINNGWAERNAETDSGIGGHSRRTD